MNYINLTNQDVILNSGEKYEISGEYPPALVKETIGEFENNEADVTIDSLTELPQEQDGVKYIVPRPYAAAYRQTGGDRQDIVCAATFHPETKRGDGGRILSVPGFLRV